MVSVDGKVSRKNSLFFVDMSIIKAFSPSPPSLGLVVKRMATNKKKIFII